MSSAEGLRCNNANEDDDYKTKSEVKSEKERHEDAVKLLSLEAKRLRKQTLHSAIDTGIFYNDDEGGVMEEGT